MLHEIMLRDHEYNFFIWIRKNIVVFFIIKLESIYLSTNISFIFRCSELYGCIWSDNWSCAEFDL